MVEITEQKSVTELEITDDSEEAYIKLSREADGIRITLQVGAGRGSRKATFLLTADEKQSVGVALDNLFSA